MKKITEYGEVIPGFTLRRVEREQSGIPDKYELIESGDISASGVASVHTFIEKPISYKEYLRIEGEKQETPCATGWVHIAMKESARFTFKPRIGHKIYNGIIESGWDADKLSEEKRYNELDQGVYVFELAGRLIESHGTKN